MTASTPELALLAVAVFLLGTPHGALDARLARQRLRPALGPRWWLPFIAVYLALAGAVLAAWLTVPVLALAAFLVLAAVHFGHHDSASGRLVPVLVRGSLPPVIAAVSHPEAIKSIFVLLAGDGGRLLAEWLAGPLFLTWLAGALATLVMEPATRKRIELLLIAALFLVAPPLVAFALYFAFIHSPRALAESRRPGETWSDLLRAAMPWTVAAVALALPLWAWFAPSLGEGPAMVRTVFWWLSALTVPHMALHLLPERPRLGAGTKLRPAAALR